MDWTKIENWKDVKIASIKSNKKRGTLGRSLSTDVVFIDLEKAYNTGLLNRMFEDQRKVNHLELQKALHKVVAYHQPYLKLGSKMP